MKTATFPLPNYSEYANKSPVELVEMFLDSNIYWKNPENPNITLGELRCFIAILILSGYNNLPGKNFYWDSGADMGKQMVKETMRRDRFRQIMRFLHCANNSKPDANDKLWKLRPLIDMLQENFSKHFKPSEHLNYDESMVKYYGRHSRKQFIRGKPIRFGYKVWCLNAANSYLVNFDILSRA
ncbi:hypothetical protein PPYR_00676 [Photinus pyralis]|uniref:PiggyBac transposable element-derived protein domain-containing protein n=1 Tax=Photinus pyralis TaxID=7054 RepID=A0A5N4B2B7_PHOPY|nr:hypothetical protein PPYR_00676 [Photinus pyralis]